MQRIFLKLKQSLKAGSFAEFCFLNKKIRVRLSLLLGLIFSSTYLVFNLVSGIVYRSAPFIIVAIYYMLLAGVRYMILRSDPSVKTRDDAILVCRRGGILLMLMDALIAVMIFNSISMPSGRDYGIVVFTFLGVHTLYAVISGVFGVIEGRRDGLIMHRAAYSVKIAAAAMSLFNLLSAIIARFVYPREVGDVLTTVFGILVCLCVFILACTMIFSRTKRSGNLV